MKKILYNVYLYLTMFLGISLVMLEMFYIPANYNIDSNVQQAMLIISIVITLLVCAILCNNFADKLEKYERKCN